ncbi:MAG: plasmid pRiA4b ORF-3 family protein [Spirochaetaceae bacterium]|jgi:hypothetical protein|nr:plasmid pRiA4b ORF-3 family protein [Spirochaetaceae bacterium]
MTPEHEDALYDFLETVTEPFSLESVTSYIKMVVRRRAAHLAQDIRDFINSRNIAFRQGRDKWISRRGYFEPLSFVIHPTRLELLNGILIPGHRCVPFANPVLMPQEYTFYWKANPIPWGTTEGPPEDFYPYYTIYGEEYASQYVARDNPENESAYSRDLYEDPAEVSIHTLDMRKIYRETALVPGDRFIVKTKDWGAGNFELTHVKKNTWTAASLSAWCDAAERGFADSFEILGPGSSTDEQIAFAYWFGDERMGEVPAYSLEEFLYEKTNSIETSPYGIETRFWYAGKDIPDLKKLEGFISVSDRTPIEEMLFRSGVPVSEYVLQAYVRDALFRKEPELSQIVERIAPRSTDMTGKGREELTGYVFRVYTKFQQTYSIFSDRMMGPIRQRVGELHTAVIDLVARLHKGDIDLSWLPKHTFVVLSQIQSHAAGILDDLDDEAPPEEELEAVDASVDNMIETYEDIKELIDDAMNNFRRNNLSVVKASGAGGFASWHTVQLTLGGTNVWRRVVIPGYSPLDTLHRVIQTLFGWDNRLSHRFFTSVPLWDENISLEGLNTQGCAEIIYEYGTVWTVKILFLSSCEAGEEERIRCLSGEGAAPPLSIKGPLPFKKFLAALERGGESEWRLVRNDEEECENFDPNEFSIEACNYQLEGIIHGRARTKKKGI